MLGREMRRVIIASLVVAASLAVPAASATVAGGGWSKPATLLPAGNLAYQPTIAVARNGTAVVVWNQYDSAHDTFSVMAAVRTPQGKIAKSKLGPAAGAFSKPALAVGGNGTFALAWAYPGAGASQLAVKIMAPGKRTFGATTKISGSNLSSDFGAGDSPSVAVNDTGAVFVAYVGKFGPHYQVVERQEAKGRWSSAVRLSDTGVDSHGAQIAADGAGAVVVSWAEPDSSVWAVTKSSAGASFGPTQKIAGATYETTPADVGVSDKGKSAIIWEQGGANGTHRIASKVAHGHFPSKLQYVSPSNAIARYQALAIPSNGAGAAAWEQEVAGGWEIDAASLSASGSAWAGSKRITATGYAATPGSAPVVAANDKLAVVAWSEKDLHHASFVGVSTRIGSRWSTPTDFDGLNAPVIAVANDPSKSPVAAAMVWLSTKGLQISILK